MTYKKRRIKGLLNQKDCSASGNPVARVNDTLHRLCLDNISITVELLTGTELSDRHKKSLFSSCSYMATASLSLGQRELINKLLEDTQTPGYLRIHCEWFLNRPTWISVIGL